MLCPQPGKTRPWITPLSATDTFKALASARSAVDERCQSHHVVHRLCVLSREIGRMESV
jgi:hypothetical protein